MHAAAIFLVALVKSPNIVLFCLNITHFWTRFVKMLKHDVLKEFINQLVYQF